MDLKQKDQPHISFAEKTNKFCPSCDGGVLMSVHLNEIFIGYKCVWCDYREDHRHN